MDIMLRTNQDTICDPVTIRSADYNRHYLRNAILSLIKYHKPVIVTGSLKFQAYEYYYSFIDIKPFYPSAQDQARVLCQHVNIAKRQIDPLLNLYGMQDYTQIPLVLICRPYAYRSDTTGEERGGLNLTSELGVPGIMTYENALKVIPSIDPSRYVDFKDFGAGTFLGIDTIQLQKEKQQQKIAKRLLVKKDIKNKDRDDIEEYKINIKDTKDYTALDKRIRQNKKCQAPLLQGWFLKI